MNTYSNQAFSGYSFAGPTPTAPTVAAPAPAPIQAPLPFGSGGATALSSLGLPAEQGIARLGQDYQTAYNSALAQNKSTYDNILAGYQQTLASNTTAQQAIQAGYTNLYNQVQDRLAGQGQTRATDITANAAQQLGSQSQGLIDRGLGNTTVQNSVARGIDFDKQRALSANAEAVAAQQADYMGRIGQAGLGFQQQSLQQNSNLQQDQLNWMNSTTAPYPNAGLYSQLANQYGQTAQQQRNAAQIAAAGKYGGGSFAGSAAPASGGRGSNQQLGYVPTYRGSEPAAYGPPAAGGAAGMGAWAGVPTSSGGYTLPSQPAVSQDGSGGDYGAYGPYNNLDQFAGMANSNVQAAGSLAGGDLGYNPSDYGNY